MIGHLLLKVEKAFPVRLQGIGREAKRGERGTWVPPQEVMGKVLSSSISIVKGNKVL